MPPQFAGWPHDTGAAIRAKAFDDRLTCFEPPYDLAKGDVLGGFRKANPPLLTPPCRYKAGFAKIAYDLDQMILRDRQFLRELPGPKRSLRFRRKPHQGSKSEI